DGRAGGADGEGAQGLVYDRPPDHAAVQGRADQMDALPRDADRLANGARAEGILGVGARAALGAKIARAVAGKRAAVGGGGEREPAEAKQGPALEREEAVPDDLAVQGVAAQPLRAPRQGHPDDLLG